MPRRPSLLAGVTHFCGSTRAASHRGCLWLAQDNAGRRKVKLRGLPSVHALFVFASAAFKDAHVTRLDRGKSRPVAVADPAADGGNPVRSPLAAQRPNNGRDIVCSCPQLSFRLTRYITSWRGALTSFSQRFDRRPRSKSTKRKRSPGKNRVDSLVDLLDSTRIWAHRRCSDCAGIIQPCI